MTEHIPANAEGMPKTRVGPSVNIEKAKRRETAIDSGYLVLSLLQICCAASDYSEDQPDAPLAGHMHSSIKSVLEHTMTMTSEMLSVLELSEMRGEVTPC